MINILTTASLQQTLTIQSQPAQASGTSASLSLPDAKSMGLLKLPETLEGLHSSLKELDKKIKEIEVKLAANTLIESLSRAGLSGVDTAVATFSASGTDNGAVPAITKVVMTTKDIFKAILDGVNLWRVKDNEKPLKSTTDAFTYAIDNIATSAGCSAETAAKASSFGGYILNVLSDLAGTFSSLDPAVMSPEKKKTVQYVTFATAGAKALTGVSKPFNDGLKAQKSALEKIKGDIEELIRQKEDEKRNPPQKSHGIQNTAEVKEKSNDTRTLTKFKNKTTYTRIKAAPESDHANLNIKELISRNKSHTKA